MELEFIPASKVYAEFGVPRNLLRDLADRGIVARRASSFDGGANVLYTYSRADLARYMNGEVSNA